jgi:hypothetical protein
MIGVKLKNRKVPEAGEPSPASGKFYLHFFRESLKLLFLNFGKENFRFIKGNNRAEKSLLS